MQHWMPSLWHHADNNDDNDMMTTDNWRKNQSDNND